MHLEGSIAVWGSQGKMRGASEVKEARRLIFADVDLRLGGILY